MTTASATETTAPPTEASWWRRQRSTLVIVAAIAVAVLVVVVLGVGGVRTSTPLDPDNPDPGGAQALARVLDDHGVDVTVVRGADALDASPVPSGTTVLVTSTDQLGESTIRRMLDDTREADLVLAAPGPGTTEALGLSGSSFTVTAGDPRDAGCSDPRFAGLSLEMDHALEYPSADGCFRGRHGVLVAEPRDGLTLLGASEALSNDQVLRADNAAAMLRLLGGGDRLVWYVPSIDDLVADDGVSLSTLLPRWIRPALWLGALALVALVVWRARRLGPLATEPLPVVVKAIETTHSRGRLYRRSGDRAHAAAALRSAARSRAREHLRLGPGSDDGTLVHDVARQVGRPAESVAALIAPDAPAPTTDPELIALANDLAELDREVRRT
ncbi:DUF4350 domain-containing protein [Nocardioides koreensis]|uniref:DUF4350 domain-containing protein n=1 Tax=Nocardioides koreensis TaxID=433651 RepID=A0ABP5KXK7_9ACTN